MDTVSNVVLSVLFGAIAIWLFRGVYKTGKLVIKDYRWNASRILFFGAGVLCLLSLFAYSTLLDWVRIICMMAAVVAFSLLRDGLSEKGIASMGNVTPYSSVQHYDYQTKKKTLDVYVYAVDKKKEEYQFVVRFDLKDQEKVIAYLKEKCGKKYTRMKKR